MLILGEEFPNFDAETNKGKINFHTWLGDSWGILFSHPADYTPVCTTELGRVAQLLPEFEKRGIKLLALSCDSADSHNGWAEDIKECCSVPDVPYPIIADDKRQLVVKLGMLDKEEINSQGLALSARCVFVVGPDKKLKLSILYPATTGRNFDEILRVIDSLQLTAKHPVATPVDWQVGDRVMVQPSLKQEDAVKMFPKGIAIKEVPSGKQYLRYTPMPE